MAAVGIVGIGEMGGAFVVARESDVVLTMLTNGAA
jgi:hypothetical protein